jgi:hypothetical protein
VVLGRCLAIAPSHQRAALATLLLLCTTIHVRAAPCDAPVPIVFARGAVAAEVTGASPRGTPECWTLEARAGQHLSAQVRSTGNDVVFQIFRPGSTYKQGAPAPGSAPLDKSVSEGKDARSFSGKLPQTGKYLFVLGSKWGGGEYKLQVKVTK